MSTHDLIVQRPAMPGQLVLLFHGVGSSARDLAPFGEALALHLPAAAIVSLQAPEAAGPGWQWFSVQGATEADRPARVATAMPAFVRAVRHWQAACAIAPEQTTLVGFSQGAIMALESTQLDGRLAERVIALSDRFARPPRVAHASGHTHLVHGDADAVMAVQLAVDALDQLQRLGAVARLDRFPGLGYGIDRRVVDAIVGRLDEARPAWHGSTPMATPDLVGSTASRERMPTYAWRPAQHRVRAHRAQRSGNNAKEWAAPAWNAAA
jgi:phospholipase/carboxylesterase